MKPKLNAEMRRRSPATQTRRKRRQRGGFYPSAYAGIEGAKYLLPLAMRQAYRMWNNKTTTRRRRKKNK